MKVLEIIESDYNKLTAGEKKVADYFLEQKYDIVSQTLSEISEAARVGEATVVRFCNKLGYKKFRDIKLNMDLENATENRVEARGHITSIETKINSSIRKTIEALDTEVLNQAIDMIHKAENVVIIGVGASGLSAQAMATRFIRIGKLCHYITDSHLQAMYAAWASSNSVIVVFSLSGRTKDILETIKLAKKNNVKVIAITNFKKSLLANMADIVLQTLSRDGPLNGGSLSAVVNQVFVADLLITGYAFLDEDKSINIKEAVHKAIIGKMRE